MFDWAYRKSSGVPGIKSTQLIDEQSPCGCSTVWGESHAFLNDGKQSVRLPLAFRTLLDGLNVLLV
jgi:hypothetical protein